MMEVYWVVVFIISSPTETHVIQGYGDSGHFATKQECASVGKTTVRVLREPKNGKVEVDVGPGFPSYPKDNIRFKCNEKSVDVTRVWYTSNGDFKGRDIIDLGSS